jgi:hypothetical protein
MTRAIGLVTAIAMLLTSLNVADAAPVPQGVVDAVYAIRARGCGGKPGVETALRRDDRLDRAAAALAAGEQLKDALYSADYRATQAALLEASANAGSISASHTSDARPGSCSRLRWPRPPPMRPR